MTNSVKISVVTRTRDRPIFLRRAAQHLMLQTMKGFEWVIVNDGGNLEITESACEGFKVGSVPTQFLHQPQSFGRGHAAQTGLEAAQGDYILFHDDDDWLAPSGLATLYSCIENNGECVAATCAVQPVTETMKKNKWVIKRYEKILKQNYPPTLQEIAYSNTILTISTLFKRKVALAVGGVNPALYFLEDWDLWIRLLMQGDFAISPEVLAFQSLRPGSLEMAQSRREDHMVALSQIRNHYLRTDIMEGRASLGTLLNPHNRAQFEDFNHITTMLKKFKRALRRA